MIHLIQPGLYITLSLLLSALRVCLGLQAKEGGENKRKEGIAEELFPPAWWSELLYGRVVRWSGQQSAWSGGRER